MNGALNGLEDGCVELLVVHGLQLAQVKLKSPNLAVVSTASTRSLPK